MLPQMLDIGSVRRLYTDGAWTPATLMIALADRMDQGDPAAFITRTSRSELTAAAADLVKRAPEPNSLPLWGIPFAVKDNIDVAGLPTTAACPAFAHEVEQDATVVARLRAAGAIVIGKTNLDQFATGLNGTRSPYGIPRCVFDSDYISGGSSSGSAVAVASGLASFSLGTDTAGSGRVPAGINNIVGIKPTPGLISSAGMVPACQSLDCTSIFAATVEDGAIVRRVAEGFDAKDPFSRSNSQLPLPSRGLRVGILAEKDRQFFGDHENDRLYRRAIEAVEQLGASLYEIDYAPFATIAALLYEGPWVAERLAAFESFGISSDDLDSSVRAITLGGQAFSAADAFRGQYRLAELKHQTDAQLAKIDVMLLPTAPTIYRVDEMLAEPILLNSRLGIYTNFFNLLGLSAIAVPAGFRSNGLPSGITLAARGFQDEALVPITAGLHQAIGSGSGIDREFTIPAPVESEIAEDRLSLAVVGAHLSGMTLNHELVALGAVFESAVRTSADYRLFLVPNTQPAKPGLVRQRGFDGPGINLEIWSFTPDAFGKFVERVPAPLAIGKILLSDGNTVSGFIGDADALKGAKDITDHGGWRAFLAAQQEVAA